MALILIPAFASFSAIAAKKPTAVRSECTVSVIIAQVCSYPKLFLSASFLEIMTVMCNFQKS